MLLNNKTALLIIFLTLANYTSQAQVFNIVCDTADFKSKSAPYINIIETSFDDEAYFTKPITMQQKQNRFYGSVSTMRPVFITLASTQLLAIPNKNVSGVLSRFGDVFIIKDTNNINRLFRDIDDTITHFVIQYSKATNFDKFLGIFDSLKYYVNNVISYVASPYARKRYSIDIEVVAAINQYCKARLACFTVLPVLLNGKYTDELTKLIEENFKKIDANYWLQIQPGRIFLRTYFTKIMLAKNNYDLQKSLNYSPLFKDKKVRNYSIFNYFKDCLSNDSTSNNLNLIKKEFTQFETENKFTEDEQRTLQRLKSELLKSGSNIIPLFSKQVLVNGKGQYLTIDEKNALLHNKGNILIDYWASWCGPCIAFIKTLKSDEIVYQGEKYKIIFISTDKNQQNWLGKNFPVLKPYNSFRLTDLKNYSFYKVFQITAIPRLFLIKNGIVINQNFEKNKL